MKNTVLRLGGNPLCSNSSLATFCGSEIANNTDNRVPTNSTASCPSQSCPPPYEYSRTSPVKCFCAAPLIVQYRLKSPGFSDFRPYINLFESYLTSGLDIYIYQLYLETFMWQEGKRVRMFLKLFPVYNAQNDSSHTFNRSEVLRIRSMFTGWLIPDNDIFGPYELLGFTLLDPYKDGKS